jgi:hypothetical protein
VRSSSINIIPWGRSYPQQAEVFFTTFGCCKCTVFLSSQLNLGIDEPMSNKTTLGFLFAVAISVEQDEVNTYLPKGDMWSVHKFGGTCMGTPKRIQSVADIVLGDSSERKLIIVSAMSKVTDMMYNLVQKAQSRDDSYAIALEEVSEKHMAAAKDLLDGEDLANFLSQLHSDVSNLRAMLHAIFIGLSC